MEYAKLMGSLLIMAPEKIKKDGMVIMNPGPDLLTPLGYKPLSYTERPDISTPGNELREVYTDNGDRITVTWEEFTPEPAPYVPEPIPDATIRQVAMFATMAVNSMSLSDEQALEIKDLHPEWSSFIGKSLAVGFKVLYEGRLYKVRQQIATVLENQAPSEFTAALYEEINETAAGTLEDPIPYNGNMELLEGKYYSQNGVTYKCTRSTGQAVYHDLSALVGIYVEKV